MTRTAAVDNPSTQSTIAPRLWPAHPTVVTDRTMAEIGAGAARGEAPSPKTLAAVEDIARKAPLAPEPFLIMGAVAQVQQRQELAERLFTAARTRDPRSVAARYFLADRYLRTGRTPQALIEMAALSRLFPGATAQFAPAVAAFARSPGTVPLVRGFFRRSPEFEPIVLSELVSDPRNADLVLALWGSRYRPADADAARWQATLVNKLVEQGELGKAYSAWRLFAGANESQWTIFNPSFAKVSAPPPFNWTFASAGGVVDPLPNGRLEVIYFGRADAVLAEQLLLLPTGRYRLEMDISAAPGKGGDIAWALTCITRTEPFFRLAVRDKGHLAGDFLVAPDCAAQRLQLIGSAGDFPGSQDFTLGKLSMNRVARR